MENRFDPNQPIYTECFEAVRPELEAMPPEDVQPIRHDIVGAILVALGTMPRLQTLRERVVAELGEADARPIDRLETVTRACGKAHALHLTTLHGTDVEEMAGRISQMRTVLLLEVQALISRGVMSSSVIGELVGGTSYRGMYLDVLQLASAVRHDWAKVEAFTGLTTLELDQAESLANAFSTVVGENEQGTNGSPTGDMRRRAYTLFVQTYEDVRRAATYCHWRAGDADEIAPSLASGRKRSETEEPPLVPVIAPPNGTPPVRPGMPGAPPFAPA